MSLRHVTSEKKSNRMDRIASGRIRRIVFILLIFKEFPIELRPPAAAQLEILSILQVDAYYPSYPAACDPVYPVTFLLRCYMH